MKSPVILALGVCHRDVELAVLWLKWVRFLCSQPGGDNSDSTLMVVHTHRVAPEQVRALEEAAVTRDGSRGMFQVDVVRCPDEDESGYPKSASHLFLRTLEAAERLWPGHAVLWAETDTVPMKPSWFLEIASEYQTCGKPFLGMRVGTQHPHLSGNSIYPADWRQIAPSIATVLTAPDYALWGPGKGQPWDVWCRHETTPQMAETRLMYQVWKDRDLRPTRLKDIPEGTCLFHQDKTGTLIREIASLRYPEFMATLADSRRYYLLRGHPNRLKFKGHPIKFSFEKWGPGGWIAAVCSDELDDSQAAAVQLMVGKLGLREIDEQEFERITKRKGATIPRRERTAPVVDASHPSVFVMLGRYGDIMNILPMLKAEADAGRRPTLVVSQDFADILDGVSYCDRIVWEGAYDALPDALRWLRRSHGIPAPVICQYHRHPTDKARLTDSYQKECWRLAGRLAQFATRGPLVFDKRDPERERKLVWDWLGENEDNPIIVLLGLESASSPLPDDTKMAIKKAIESNRKRMVIDLAKVRASRIYDLIALIEHACVLVTADTSFLHLARATKTPVVALLNDGWRGSVPHDGVTSIRYAGVLAEPTLVASAVNGIIFGPDRPPVFESEREIVTVGGKSLGKTSAMDAVMTALAAEPRVIHVVDCFGDGERHVRAAESWERARGEGLELLEGSDYTRDASTVCGDPRKLPFLKDMLERGLQASTSDHDIILWTNTDIALAPGIAEVLLNSLRFGGARSMRRTESNGQPHIGRDLFAFTAGWLREKWDELPDYIIGAPVFDLGLVAMIRKHAGCTVPTTMRNMKDDLPGDLPPGFALHQSHESEWDDNAPSAKWNREQFYRWAKAHAPEMKFTPAKRLK